MSAVVEEIPHIPESKLALQFVIHKAGGAALYVDPILPLTKAVEALRAVTKDLEDIINQGSDHDETYIIEKLFGR